MKTKNLCSLFTPVILSPASFDNLMTLDYSHIICHFVAVIAEFLIWGTIKDD